MPLESSWSLAAAGETTGPNTTYYLSKYALPISEVFKYVVEMAKLSCSDRVNQGTDALITDTHTPSNHIVNSHSSKLCQVKIVYSRSRFVHVSATFPQKANEQKAENKPRAPPPALGQLQPSLVPRIVFSRSRLRGRGGNQTWRRGSIPNNTCNLLTVSCMCTSRAFSSL